MKVKELMVKNVVFVDPETRVVDVAATIFENRFHAVPVIKDGKVVGIITENDFFTKNSSNLYLPSYIKFLEGARIADDLPEEKKKQVDELMNAKAKDIMTADCLCISPEEDVENLLNMIQKTGFCSYPVAFEDKKILGIITLMDVIGLVRENKKFGDYQEKEKSREVDSLAKEVHSWWGSFFVFMSRSRIKTWKGALFLAAFAGAVAVFIWNIFWS